MIARKYLYLIALAKEKHFGRAAAACHVSTSTLSAAIQGLESELGVALVERGQHFAALTPQGEQVLDYAQRMAALSQSLRQDLARAHGGLTGQLRLGVIPTALAAVAELTAMVARHHPRVTIVLHSASTRDIVAGLRDFSLDAGIVYRETGDAADFCFVPVWTENHVLIAPPSDSLEGRTTLPWREAALQPLCLLTPDMQNRKIIDQVFADLGCQVTPRLEANSMLSILAHVRTGSWCSIVPRAVLEVFGRPAGIQLLELTEPSVMWDTGLITLDTSPPSPMVAAIREQARLLRGAFGKDE